MTVQEKMVRICMAQHHCWGFATLRDLISRLGIKSDATLVAAYHATLHAKHVASWKALAEWWLDPPLVDDLTDVMAKGGVTVDDQGIHVWTEGAQV